MRRIPIHFAALLQNGQGRCSLENTSLLGKQQKYWNHSFGLWKETFYSQASTAHKGNKEPLWRQGLFSDEKMKQTLQTNVRFWGFESSEVEVRFEIFLRRCRKRFVYSSKTFLCGCKPLFGSRNVCFLFCRASVPHGKRKFALHKTRLFAGLPTFGLLLRNNGKRWLMLENKLLPASLLPKMFFFCKP